MAEPRSSINDIRARWSDPGHADSDADKRDVRALLRRIDELEQEVRFYETERFALARIEGAEPLPVVHAQALLTYHEESYAEGFVAGMVRSANEVEDARLEQRREPLPVACLACGDVKGPCHCSLCGRTY